MHYSVRRRRNSGFLDSQNKPGYSEQRSRHERQIEICSSKLGGTYTISDLKDVLFVQFLQKPVDARCRINDLHIDCNTS
eukprot:765105-Hanusia_phi.AAC.5